jgi:drug/metabolite transporter (DMT)-like permease
VLAGAALFQKTPATAIQMIGAAIAFVGLVLVTSRGDPGVLLSMDLNSGDALMLIACAFYAIYTLSLKNRPQVPGTVFFTVMALCAAVSAIPFLLFEAVTTGIDMPTSTGWLVLLFVAIFPSCLAQLFFLWGVDRVGPGRAGMFANLVPVFAALLAVLILGEQFRWFHGAALILVVGGIWLVQTVKSPK